MAAGIGVLLLVFLVVVINACQTSRKKNALRDWNTQATQIVSQSDSDVAARFFDVIRQAETEQQSLQASISSLRQQADANLKAAKELDTPGELESARFSLLTALEFRRDALDYTATRITAAIGSGGDAADQAIEGITGEMQAFLASDVLIRMRVTPLVSDTLKDNDVVADAVRTDGSLPGFSWLNPPYVAQQLGTSLTGTEVRERNKAVAPGTHGSGLTGTSVDGVALEPDPASNKVPADGELLFTVSFENQGENDETNIPVTITLQGGAKDITGKAVVPSVTAGTAATAEVTLKSKPTAGEVYTVNTVVQKVPGEQMLENNKASYNVLFE